MNQYNSWWSNRPRLHVPAGLSVWNLMRWVIVCCIGVIGTAALACQVPVFRYALERWPPDRYELVVLHSSPLTAQQQNEVKRLRQSTREAFANCTLRSVRIDQENDPMAKAFRTQVGDSSAPVVAVLYPRNAQEVPDRFVDTVALDKKSLKYLADSPVRKTIAKRLIDGQSAVWIFVPIGDPKQDQEALRVLQTEVQRNQDSLELPEQEEVEGEEELLAEVDIELRLEFSIVTLDRNDPKEQHLLKMLLASEPDLEDLKQPMAFPVLGRGRVLYALIGKGIAEDTISIASRFIIGPCSCQVKNQNPGFDLLMQCDWDAEIGTEKLSDEIPEERTTPKLLTIPPGRK